MNCAQGPTGAPEPVALKAGRVVQNSRHYLLAFAMLGVVYLLYTSLTPSPCRSDAHDQNRVAIDQQLVVPLRESLSDHDRASMKVHEGVREKAVIPPKELKTARTVGARFCPHEGCTRPGEECTYVFRGVCRDGELKRKPAPKAPPSLFRNRHFHQRTKLCRHLFPTLEGSQHTIFHRVLTGGKVSKGNSIPGADDLELLIFSRVG